MIKSVDFSFHFSVWIKAKDQTFFSLSLGTDCSNFPTQSSHSIYGGGKKCTRSFFSQLELEASNVIRDREIVKKGLDDGHVFSLVFFFFLLLSSCGLTWRCSKLTTWQVNFNFSKTFTSSADNSNGVVVVVRHRIEEQEEGKGISFLNMQQAEREREIIMNLLIEGHFTLEMTLIEKLKGKGWRKGGNFHDSCCCGHKRGRKTKRKLLF